MFGRDYEKKIEEELEKINLPNSVKNNKEEVERLSDKALPTQDKDDFERQISKRENIVSNSMLNIDNTSADIEKALNDFEDFVESDEFDKAKDKNRVSFDRYKNLMSVVMGLQQIVGNAYVAMSLMNDTNKKLQKMVSFEGHLKDQQYIIDKVTDFMDKSHNIHESSMDAAVKQLKRAVDSVESRERRKSAEIKKMADTVNETLQTFADNVPELEVKDAVTTSSSSSDGTSGSVDSSDKKKSGSVGSSNVKKDFLKCVDPYETSCLKDKEEFRKSDSEFAKSGRVICPICGGDYKDWRSFKSHVSNKDDSKHVEFKEYL